MSRLYPGWGSGKQAFEETYSVYPLACLGREDMEGGDKVVLPQSTFRKVSRLKLPFPLTFEVTNPRLQAKKTPTMAGGVKKQPLHANGKKVIPKKPGAEDNKAKGKGKKGPPKQYCGVMEFSGPEEKVFIPYWMMQNLRLKEGAKVNMKTVFKGKIPKGTFCRLQPHTTAFIDLAASMDLRELLEHSFRNYSVLSVGETIVVNFAGENYKIDVVETQPEAAISLYGNLDLEVDFAPPLDCPDVGKVRAGSSRGEGRESNNNEPKTIGDLLKEGGTIIQANQLPSPKQQKSQEGGSSLSIAKPPTTETEQPQQPQGHQWGKGQSLNGDVVVDGSQKAQQQQDGKCSPTQEGVLEGLPPRRAKRRPSKFAQRTGGSSFIGNGASLEKEQTPEVDSESTPEVSSPDCEKANQVAVFAGVGRSLTTSSDETENQGKPTQDAIRARRLKFLENLQQQKSTNENDRPPSTGDKIAVGSGLSGLRAIRNSSR